jgi:NAD(P)-dependent dehydrogenase (short-subunit alcohol dehydrogenase family)
MSRLTVIITGATKGLGRAMALSFTKAGHTVIGLYSNDETSAESLRAELHSSNALFELVKHDVASDDRAVWGTPAITQAEHLVLINNAWCSFTPTPLHLLTWDDFQRGLDVGVQGSWNCIRALLRPMVKAGQGTVVNVLSAAIHELPPRGFTAYATAKHAQRGLMLGLVAEYRSKGIRAFSVTPAFMSTPLTAAWDERLIAAVTESGALTDPIAAAQRVRQLIEDPATPGEGEDYTL